MKHRPTLLAAMLVLPITLLAGCPHAVIEVDDLVADFKSGKAVSANHGVLFWGRDCLVTPGQQVMLRARLQKPNSFRGIAGSTITFFDGQTAIAAAVTDNQGEARVSWQPPGEGYFEITAKVIDPGPNLANRDGVRDVSAGLLVAVRPPDAQFIVVDLDHTVCDAGWVDVLTENPRTMEHCVGCLNRLADSYDIIYLTLRPDELTRRSKQWLRDSQFPRGVLMTCSARDMLGDAAAAKSSRLASLRKSFPNIAIGVGDQFSDMRAYLANDMTAYLIPTCKSSPRLLRQQADDIRHVPQKDRVQVVVDWRQIESGIIDGRRYSADDFADRLDRLAGKGK